MSQYIVQTKTPITDPKHWESQHAKIKALQEKFFPKKPKRPVRTKQISEYTDLSALQSASILARRGVI
ncbi:hypothetical protein PCIT_a3056 [Pseudoalteromonas citrea]|uniref:Uncharacterized protein n=2 Tax=Pseudoalteromonas citrea TaxID=43655 RepID=A0AAD4AI91_9GAMM|nr:hypothetical protein [Pseudoalteromonas citrea]KAF7770099.1 hypothetical protein PCIT_a3056 [Pseudoalteromonas citrea]